MVDRDTYAKHALHDTPHPVPFVLLGTSTNVSGYEHTWTANMGILSNMKPAGSLTVSMDQHTVSLCNGRDVKPNGVVVVSKCDRTDNKNNHRLAAVVSTEHLLK